MIYADNSPLLVAKLYALDNTHTMQFVGLDDADICDKSREEEVADKLMDKFVYVEGTVGIHKKTYSTYIMTSRGWVSVIRGDDGKHYLAE